MPTPTTTPQPGGPAAGAGLSPGYELFIIVVTVLSVVNWVFLVLPFNLGADSRGLLIFMEPIFTVILLSDFAVRLRRARGRRWAYMNAEGGWLDLIGSLPYGRVLRVFRLLRVIQAFHAFGWRSTVRWFVVNRAQGTLFLVLGFLLVVLEVGGLVVLYFEAGAPRSNIETGGEALWWGIVTVFTVGYGDYYPVTPGGQVTATIMIFAGVAIVSIFTAWVASVFLTPRMPTAPGSAGSARPAGPSPDGEQAAAIIHDLRTRLDELESLVASGHDGPSPGRGDTPSP
jgi:voltage-gated potassium channel